MWLAQETPGPEQGSKAGQGDRSAWLDGDGKMGENLHVFVNPLTFQARSKA